MKTIWNCVSVFLLAVCCLALFGAVNLVFADEGQPVQPAQPADPAAPVSSADLPQGMRQFTLLAKTGYRMAVSSNARDANIAVNTAKLKDKALTQKFYVFKATADSAGYYYIGSMISGYYLADVNDNLIQQKGETDKPTDNQLWSAAKNSYGYTLTNKASGKLITLVGKDLRLEAAKSGKAAKSQSFKLPKTKYKTRAYRIVASNGLGLALNSKKRAKNVTAKLAKVNTTANAQRFHVGASGANVKISRALTSRYLPTVSLRPTGDGYFFLLSASGSYLSCADLSVGSTVALAKSADPGAEQKFSIYAATHYSTGKTALDKKISKILTSIGASNGNLKKIYRFVLKKYHYRGAHGKSHPRGTWVNKYASNMIKYSGGNCYSYAAVFTTLAKAAGYKSNVQLGYVKVRNGWAPHGWSEVRKGGVTYICDTQEADSMGRDFYMKRYSNAPLIYRQTKT